MLHEYRFLWKCSNNYLQSWLQDDISVIFKLDLLTILFLQCCDGEISLDGVIAFFRSLEQLIQFNEDVLFSTPANSEEAKVANSVEFPTAGAMIPMHQRGEIS